MLYPEDVIRGIKIQNNLANFENQLGLNLKDSPIILRKPLGKIFHQINGELNSSAEYVIRSAIGDHDTLMQCLNINSSKIIDKYQRIAKFLNDCNPPTHIDALLRANVLGYKVQKSYLKEIDVSYGEKEAYHAAWMMASLNWYPGNLLTHSYWKEWRDSVYQKIKFFTAQFIVPKFSSLEQYKYTPYVIDQLWIVRESDSTVRLIGLEIDGEHHLETDEQKERDNQRDERLANMGYEMYHVAAWWCRVDPYRVISEVLKATDITPGISDNFYYSNFKSINDYKCDICQNLIVRYQQNDLVEIERNGHSLKAHRSCSDNYQHGI
jgi:very-short-patch-repair endonuclease